MTSKEALYEKIAEAVNITEEMFDYADSEYRKMGKWIEEHAKDYGIVIYPQGSFALGTAIKPVGREDEYDVDLVCEYQKNYGFTAERLKSEVRSILSRYGRAKRITEKRRCWQVTYEHNDKFHMDVIPAILQGGYIDITNKKEDGTYTFQGSNPRGYVKWFQGRQSVRYRAIKESIIANTRGLDAYKAAVEPIKEYTIRTPLQKAIQILKRHRDVTFQDDKNHLAPISILITTICATLYNNEDTIEATLLSFLNGAKTYIESQKDEDKYYIFNPSFPRENFADKWNEHPERAEAFLSWIDDAKRDLIDNFDLAQDEVQLATLIESSLGRAISRAVYADKPHVVSDAVKARECDEKALGSTKVKAILNAPQRKRMPSYPKEYQVFIRATVEKPDGTIYRYANDGEPIDKNCSIEFNAIFSVVHRPFKLKWQVVNIGEQARLSNCLRGDFEEGELNSTKRRESTLYTGSHGIQCFVFKKGRCVAQSRIFIVNIK